MNESALNFSTRDRHPCIHLERLTVLSSVTVLPRRLTSIWPFLLRWSRLINQTEAALAWRKVQSLTNLLAGDAELLHRWRQQHHLALTADLVLVLLVPPSQNPLGERQKYTHPPPLTPHGNEESLIEMMGLEDPKKHKHSD